MRDKIQKQLSRLEGMRNDVLGLYLTDLEEFSVKTGSMAAVNSAGILHDLDRHITNLEMELKRMESLNLFETGVTNGQ